MNIQDRITCSVRDALAASGLGKTKFYSLMDAGRVETIKIDGKRLVRVESLMKLLGGKCAPVPTNVPTKRVQTVEN